MGARGFERRLEGLVEGMFGRVFRSTVRPVEIGRRLIREQDATRDVDVKGQPIVANAYTVCLSETDYEQFAAIHETMCAELCDAAREHARDEGYHFVGRVTCELVIDPELRTGAFAIDAKFQENPNGTGSGTLILSAGQRIILGEQTVTIGRMPGSTVLLSDPNASRQHAEIRSVGSGFVLVDLGSTNGSKVNGNRIDSHQLRNGDMLSFGSTVIRFESD